MAMSDIRGSFNSRMPVRPERPMRPVSRPERVSAPESKPKIVDKSAFAASHGGPISRNMGIEWLRKQPDLYKAFPKQPGESDWARAGRAYDSLFPTKGVPLKENVGFKLERGGNDAAELGQRMKHLNKDIRDAHKLGQGIKFNERRKDLFNRFMGKN